MHSDTVGGSRTGRTLNIANGEQARTLRRFMTRVTIINRWVIGLDLGIRSTKVNSAYQAEGRRSGLREGFRQGGGFLGSSFAIALVGAGVKGAIGMGLVLTPVGWVVIVGVGIVAASKLDGIGQTLGEGSFEQLEQVYTNIKGR